MSDFLDFLKAMIILLFIFMVLALIAVPFTSHDIVNVTERIMGKEIV